MDVLLASEARETTTATYHLAADESIRSRCGVVNPDSLFASDVYRALAQEQVERRGFEICGLCASLADS